jgi:D-alanyl-D-alanine carboxypeptidase
MSTHADCTRDAARLQGTRGSKNQRSRNPRRNANGLLGLSLVGMLVLAPTPATSQVRASGTTAAAMSTAQLAPSNPLQLRQPSSYVYETSPDFHGPLPVTLPPLRHGTDLFQWYRNRTALGKPVGDLAAAEAPTSGPWDTLATAATQTQNGVGQLPPVFASGGPAFDVDEFEDRIRDKMEDEALGYAYAINLNKQHSRSDGRGIARNSEDTFLGQSEYKRMNIASISKTVTAVAVLQLLEMNGLSVYDPVGPWLPADWTKAYGFDDPQIITFYDLLTHQSGIKQTASVLQAADPEFEALNLVKWEGLRAVVEYGIIPTYHGGAANQSYTNINFALFRVIIPALWEAAGQPVDELDANEAAAVYQAYVAENVFLPIDIHQPSCAGATGDDAPTRYYNFFDSEGTGAEGTNWTLSCGSGGWYLSAYELAKLMAYLRYSDRLLSPAMRDLMDTLKLGWSYTWSLDGDHGEYLAHAGALYFDTEDFPDRREQQGCMMKFPIHVEAVLLVNSSIESNTLPCTVLRDAFDAAWVD